MSGTLSMNYETQKQKAIGCNWGHLTLEQRREILQRVKDRFALLRSEPGLANQLIAERRLAASQENAA